MENRNENVLCDGKCEKLFSLLPNNNLTYYRARKPKFESIPVKSA